MTPSQAATLIGMSVAQVRQACRKGLIPAKKRKLDNGDPLAYVWDIAERDIVYYKYNRPQRGPKKKEQVNGRRQQNTPATSQRGH